MNAKITQDNLYMLLPLKIGWLAPWLSEDKGIVLRMQSTVYIAQNSLRSYPPKAPNTGTWDQWTYIMS